jgi:glycerol kinase
VNVLAIDQGTSGTKAIVVDESGTLRAISEVPVHPEYLPDGGVEQDPAELLTSVLTAGRQAARACGGRVDAVALANQGETVLAWDPRSGAPLSRAIVWQDRRSEGICAALAGHAGYIAERTGLVLDPYFSAPKMAWLRSQVTADGVVTTTDSWLLHHLTGELVTDVTTASRSLLLDLDSVTWHERLLAIFGLQGEALPRLVSCDEVVGTTAAFGPDAPVAGLLVDQQSALLAEGCVDPGDAKCTYGTGAFVLANTGKTAERSAAGLTASLAWRTREGTNYCLDGQVYTAGSAVRWMLDLGLVGSVPEMDGAAAPDGGGVMFVPALAGLAAPWWRPDARASLTGLGLSTGRGEIVRAVLEGIAAQVTELIGAFNADLGTPIRALRVDGGLTNSAVLLQAQADLLQMPVEVYPSPHATPLGVAAAARLALHPGLKLADVAWPWAPGAVHEPRWTADRAGEFLGRWRDALARTLGQPEAL